MQSKVGYESACPLEYDAPANDPNATIRWRVVLMSVASRLEICHISPHGTD